MWLVVNTPPLLSTSSNFTATHHSTSGSDAQSRTATCHHILLREINLEGYIYIWFFFLNLQVKQKNTFHFQGSNARTPFSDVTHIGSCPVLLHKSCKKKTRAKHINSTRNLFEDEFSHEFSREADQESEIYDDQIGIFSVVDIYALC